MTRGEIVFGVSRELGLDDTASSDELILMQRWINRGIRDVLVKTRCYLDEGDMALTIGYTEYRIDSSILAVDSMHGTSDGQTYRLKDLDMNELDAYLISNPSAGPASYYAIRGSFMRIAPAPSSAETLRFFYVPKPAEITADGTTAADSTDLANVTYGGIPEEYHDAVEAFVTWKAAAYDDKGGGFFRGHAFAPGSAYMDLYQGRIKEIRKELRGKGSRGMHAGRLGYPDRGMAGRRNDVYPEYTR